MRRPLWIGAFALAMIVAAGFAWLGQWQLSFAVQTDDSVVEVSETVRPLDEVTAAGAPVNDAAAGMVVATEGSFVAGDFTVIAARMHEGSEGVWVAGHLVNADGHLPVAIGWAPDARAATSAIAALEADLAAADSLVALEGRYMPPDGVVDPGPSDDLTVIRSMAPAQLVNLWQPFEGPSYAGFLVLHPAASSEALDGAALAANGLEAIESVPPLPAETINWLNLFYAVEWVVFAGFAVFFWYRLARDAWEKEHELKQLRATEGGPIHPSSPE